MFFQRGPFKPRAGDSTPGKRGNLNSAWFNQGQRKQKQGAAWVSSSAVSCQCLSAEVAVCFRSVMAWSGLGQAVEIQIVPDFTRA